MSYKTLLVHAEPAPASEARLDFAVHLAKDLEATLIGIGAEAFPAVAVTDPYGVSSGALFEALRSWRREQAQSQHVPPYVIFHDATLAEIAAARPASLPALAKAGGVGQGKLDRYGEAVLKVVRDN